MIAICLLSVLFMAQQAVALRCLSCNGVLAPLLCNRINICGNNEVCFTEKYVTANKEELYNVGCYPKQSCMNVTHSNPGQGYVHFMSHLDPNDIPMCSYCCHGDGCNKDMCGTSDLHVSRGPLCYDCHQTQHPDSCSYVTVCEKNEDCHVNQGSIFGRRKRQANIKAECCTSDLCNNGEFLVSARNCFDVKRNISRADGVYTIHPDNKTAADAFCDMQTDGGGWTVLLARNNGSFQGNRSWAEYKAGFGSPHGNYWIGNENIHLLTAQQPCQVYFKLQSVNGAWYFAKYDNFSVGPEAGGYVLHFNPSSFTGTAGNSMEYGKVGSGAHLNGRKFTTYDRDNDRSSGSNCASSYGGGWWHDSCFEALLTGMPENSGYFMWQYDIGHLKTAFMMIRPMSTI